MPKEKLKIFKGDIFGGLNAAIIALPQALAFGAATGFGAAAGIWGTIILCFASSLISGKIPLISGITGPVTIIIASIMNALNFDISSVLLVIFSAGIFQILLALTPFPNIVKYIPYPVISGFLNGIGVIIIIMQLNPLIGHPVKGGTLTSIAALFRNISNINPHALFIGILTLLIVFLFPRKLNKIIPSQIIALVICTFVSIKFNLNVERLSNVTSGFPVFSLPDFNLNKIIALMHYGVVLAVILSVESILTVLVCDSLLKTKTSVKRTLSAQGMGNALCSLFSSLPGSIATMRTVAAVNSGASTKLAGLVSAVILALVPIKLCSYVSTIPLAVLSGILIKIGFDIIDVKLLKTIKHAPKDDLYVLVSVFALTVFYNLIVAIGTGITGAAVLYAKKTADRTKLVHKAVYDDEIIKLEKDLDKNYHHKIRVVHIDGAFFFGSATRLVSQFEEILGTQYLILDYSSDDPLDISAIFALEDIILRLKSQNIRLLLVSSKEIKEQLNNHNILELIGDEFIFTSETDAVDYARKCLNSND